MIHRLTVIVIVINSNYTESYNVLVVPWADVNAKCKLVVKKLSTINCSKYAVFVFYIFFSRISDSTS